jgi:transcriptional regulator with XRE-family HTH domain
MTSRIQQLMQLTQGERLARARKVAGLSQDELAEMLGHDVRSVGRWERDQQPVSRSLLIAWATVTDAPLEWLDGSAFTDVLTAGEGHMAPVYMMPSLFDSDDYLMAA